MADKELEQDRKIEELQLVVLRLITYLVQDLGVETAKDLINSIDKGE